jgi:hypothetical protein
MNHSNEPTHDGRRDAAREDTRFCPSCGARSAIVADSVFVEYGEWDGDAYESEGEVDVYRCGDVFCLFEFADVTGIPRRPRGEWMSLLDPPFQPDPKTTEQGI